MECDVLFLGFGPITCALAKRLAASGSRVIVISESSTVRSFHSEFSKDSFQIMNWSDALNEQIYSHSTYIGWQQTPQNRSLGPKIIQWVKSNALRTEKIHHLSSASVYAGEKDLFLESDYNFRKSEDNLNLKRELEGLILEISHEKQTKFVNYRISNVYGAGLIQGFINESIINLKNNQPIKIYGKLDLVRDYLVIDDLIIALFELRVNESLDESLNISTGYGVAISEIVDCLKALYNDQIRLIEVEPPKELQQRSVLSCQKLEETIFWKPKRLGESLEIL